MQFDDYKRCQIRWFQLLTNLVQEVNENMRSLRLFDEHHLMFKISISILLTLATKYLVKQERARNSILQVILIFLMRSDVPHDKVKEVRRIQQWVHKRDESQPQEWLQFVDLYFDPMSWTFLLKKRERQGKRNKFLVVGIQ